MGSVRTFAAPSSDDRCADEAAVASSHLVREYCSMKLLSINRLNWRTCLGISAEPDELPYLADFEPVVLVILAKCYVQPQEQEWLPLAFEASDGIVGVCALAVADDHCELFHFLIDKSVRRKGYARKALQCIIEYMRAEHRRSVALELTVHTDNIAAQSLYSSVGFERTEEFRNGENVWRLTLRN